MVDGELESLRLEPAENGYTINVHRERKEGRKGSDSPSGRSRPKIATTAEGALGIIGKELGAKGKKGHKGAVVMMSEGESSHARSGTRKTKRKGAARKRA